MAKLTKQQQTAVLSVSKQLLKGQTPLVSLVAFIIIAGTLFLQSSNFFQDEIPTSQVNGVVTTPAATFPADITVADGEKVIVTRILDGDTIEVRQTNGELAKIRLLGIDAPEIAHNSKETTECYGDVATQVITQMASPNSEIVILKDLTQPDKDVYGRLLRYIGTVQYPNLNMYLVANGNVYLYLDAKRTSYEAQFKEALANAQTQGLGLWNVATCNGKR